MSEQDARQRMLLQAVAEASNRLLEPGALGPAITEVLAILGEAAGVDRTGIFESHPHPVTGEPALSLRYEWFKPPFIAGFDMPELQNLLLYRHQLGSWHVKLAAGEIVCDTLSQLPPEGRPLIEYLGIRSFLHVPIVVAQKFWGLISFTDNYIERSWAEAEVRVLQTMAASIGAAIQRHQIEQAIRNQEKLLHGIALATNRLLQPGNYPETIQSALAILGEVVRTDRVYIFENHPQSVTGEVAVSQRFEWTAEDVTPQIDNPILQDLPWRAHGMMRWYDTLAKGDNISGPVRDFPETEREALTAQDILSLLIVPIFINEHFWGYIGFDECRRERKWTTDEINALHTMAASVGAAIERHRGEERLANQLADIQELECIKSKVVRMASHDVRGPLSRIGVIVELLEDQLKSVLTAHQKEYFVKLQNAVSQIEELTTNILSMERFQARRHSIEPIIWHDLISQVVDTMSIEIMSCKHQLTVDCAPNLPIIRADKAEINQALSNLLGNAIKYTPPGGQITIRAFMHHYGGRLHVCTEVQDTGIGIPQEKQKQLFQPFYRAQQDGSEHINGMGLGLSIVKLAVEYHNGTVYLRSEPDCGSTFGFRLPV